jgi:hypothetical protein
MIGTEAWGENEKSDSGNYEPERLPTELIQRFCLSARTEKPKRAGNAQSRIKSVNR